MQRIKYAKDNCTFVHRAAVVITDGGRILLHRSEADGFWSLPGGHVELLESSLEAMQREVREELHESVNVERLLWIVENLFTEASQNVHEIGLYYLAHLPSNSRYLVGDGSFFGTEDFEGSQPLRLIFQWFPCSAESLEKELIYPVFLRKALSKLPEFPEHVLNIEGAAYSAV